MQNKKITILAVSGSLRATSANTQLLKDIQRWAPSAIEFIIYQDLPSIPAFDDSAEEGDAVMEWRRQLSEADGVFICSPEYAFGIPGALKNAIDWTVRTGELVNKPLALVTAASSGDKAHAAWLNIFTALSANIPEGGALLIPFIRTKLNDKGEIADAATKNAVQAVLQALIKAIEQAAATAAPGD
jgi:chromate reductase, NAD(P)H dehydrogenase (quinone)